jgi:muconolactone delta-isomerase
MRYLVTIESLDADGMVPPKEVAARIENAVVPTMKMLMDWEKSGKAKCGIFTGRRGGAMIIDADSNEALNEMLQSLPVWGFSEIDVTPLDMVEPRMKFEGGLVPMLKKM